MIFRISVVDLLNPDPDPAFQVNSDQDPMQGVDDQKLKQKIHLKIISFFDQKLQFTYP
jgi:hypothetical protein